MAAIHDYASSVKTKLITDTYRELNRELHRLPQYGASGKLYAHRVKTLADELGTRDILDYGCGKRTLEGALGFSIQNYDPCIAGLDGSPQPADIVACIDVLEHIEPELLERVLDDLRRLTKYAAFLYIATRPAKKTLADGRNAHLIQQPVDWWLGKLRERFDIWSVEPGQGAFLVIVGVPGTARPLPSSSSKTAWWVALAQWLRQNSRARKPRK